MLTKLLISLFEQHSHELDEAALDNISGGAQTLSVQNGKLILRLDRIEKNEQGGITDTSHYCEFDLEAAQNMNFTIDLEK